MRDPFGIINLDKPSGISSRQAVDHVERLVRPAKAGHAGTLDPLASGVLLIAVGSATRLVQDLHTRSKRYVATFLLGQFSPSDDIETPPEPVENAPIPTRAELESLAARMVGEIEQMPPAFSAKKLNGRRAYALARKGREVQLEPQRVTIHELTLVDYEYPRLVLEVSCSTGTYVRTLGRDLATAAGTGAVMSELRRTAIGDFAIGQSLGLEQLTADTIEQAILPATRALPDLPQVTLTEGEWRYVIDGRVIECPTAPVDHDLVAGVNSAGRLLALLGRSGKGWAPQRCFPPPNQAAPS